MEKLTLVHRYLVDSTFTFVGTKRSAEQLLTRVMRSDFLMRALRSIPGGLAPSVSGFFFANSFYN